MWLALLGASGSSYLSAGCCQCHRRHLCSTKPSWTPALAPGWALASVALASTLLRMVPPAARMLLCQRPHRIRAPFHTGTAGNRHSATVLRTRTCNLLNETPRNQSWGSKLHKGTSGSREHLSLTSARGRRTFHRQRCVAYLAQSSALVGMQPGGESGVVASVSQVSVSVYEAASLSELHGGVDEIGEVRA